MAQDRPGSRRHAVPHRTIHLAGIPRSTGSRGGVRPHRGAGNMGRKPAAGRPCHLAVLKVMAHASWLLRFKPAVPIGIVPVPALAGRLEVSTRGTQRTPRTGARSIGRVAIASALATLGSRLAFVALPAGVTPPPIADGRDDPERPGPPGLGAHRPTRGHRVGRRAVGFSRRRCPCGRSPSRPCRAGRRD